MVPWKDYEYMAGEFVPRRYVTDVIPFDGEITHEENLAEEIRSKSEKNFRWTITSFDGSMIPSRESSSASAKDVKMMNSATRRVGMLKEDDLAKGFAKLHFSRLR